MSSNSRCLTNVWLPFWENHTRHDAGLSLGSWPPSKSPPRLAYPLVNSSSAISPAFRDRGRLHPISSHDGPVATSPKAARPGDAARTQGLAG